MHQGREAGTRGGSGAALPAASGPWSPQPLTTSSLALVLGASGGFWLQEQRGRGTEAGATLRTTPGGIQLQVVVVVGSAPR